MYSYIVQLMLHCSLLWTSCLRFLTKSPAIPQQLYKTASRSLSAIAELSVLFKKASVCHLGFSKLALISTWPLLAGHSISSYKISLKSDDQLMSYGQKSDFQHGRRPPSWILKILIFGHVAVIEFNICSSVPNFIKIGRFLTEIWRFNDYQNGGRPPS